MSAAVGGAPAREHAHLHISRRAGLLATVVLWVVGFALLRGRNTLSLGETETTAFHDSLNRLNANIADGRNTSFLFTHAINVVQIWTTDFVTFLQSLLSQPGFGRPAPALGWLSVVVLGTLLVTRTAGMKYAVVFLSGFALLGLQGLWQESMDTLALTIAAVLIAVVVGVPLGISAGLNRAVGRVVTPILDVMQTLPTFVYLAPLTMLFLIGNASSTISTLIYALPPVIRVTTHGIRSVSGTTVEASDSLGATGWQTLFKVRIPMALRTIILGINQTIMAALAMVTIAALIGAPGLGQTVMQALQTLDVGTAFNAGLAIVVLAIVLDRCTTAVGERAGTIPVHRFSPRQRQILWTVAGVGALFSCYLSFTYWWANTFPARFSVGPAIIRSSAAFSDWVQNTFAPLTGAAKNVITRGMLNPFQTLLTDSPFWLVILVLAVVAGIIGGWWPALATALCLLAIAWSGLWQNSMETLALTIVATLLTMVIAVTAGVWMGRRRRADQALRPVLDAAQVMPAFVYLVPFLVLFGPSRFTAIVCSMVYAVPVAAKVVADGIKGVPENTVESARSLGASSWQVISSVQIPLAGRSLALAMNQGLIYVLAMVVVGGMVGAGGLGYQVFNGFVQDRFFGKGLAAGLAIALLGVFLDRISQAIAAHVDPSRS